MKKIYESPKTVEVRIACQKMIAASLPLNDTEVSAGDILSREGDDFDFSDDSFNFEDDELDF